MSLPARSNSSDEEELSHLAELKVVLKAKECLWAEKKVHKEQEHQEQKEQERQEQEELHERCIVEDQGRAVHTQARIIEEAKRLSDKLRGVWEAVVVVAWEMAKPEQAQVEQEQEALHQMWNGGRATEGGVELGQELSNTETKEDSEEDKQGTITQRLSRWQVVCSRQNTTKVIIV